LRDRPPLRLDAVDEVLVVAAHPDDETLGAGGLIAECERRGTPVTVVVVTDGGAAPAEAGSVARRSAELRAAMAALAPRARLFELGVPDGGTREHRQLVREYLSELIEPLSDSALVVAPWRGDGHRDHRVVGEVVAELVGRRMLAEYPIWMWHWATPDSAEVPWGHLRSLEINRESKIRAIDCYRTQTDGDAPVLRAETLEHFRGSVEYFVVEPPALPGSYFDDTYARRTDPWGFEGRWYEQRKRALTVAALPEPRFARAIEIGCSIGVLTAALSDRCDDLLGVDVSQAAVDRARERLGPEARIERIDVLESFPAGQFDLVVLSEVGYYFTRSGLERVLDAIEAALTPGGTFVACHWRHPVADHPLTGDEVHEVIRARGIPRLAWHMEEDFVLEVFSPDARSVGAREGLR